MFAIIIITCNYNYFVGCVTRVFIGGSGWQSVGMFTLHINKIHIDKPRDHPKADINACAV
jgi:hypothetical protein